VQVYRDILMFSLIVDQYTLSCDPSGLPSLYGEYTARAGLVEEFGLGDLDGATCCLTVSLGGGWPFLVLAQHYEPAGGFHPGALLIPECRLLFVGAGGRLLVYALDPPSRLWMENIEFGFLGWARHGETIIMSAELELAAWDIRGRKLWSTYVEPPWTYAVEGKLLQLDVMGKLTSFPIATGPR
jgi:hypothetical protein